MTSSNIFISNLRNRLNASKKSASYTDRCFVDVPAQHLEYLLNRLDTVEELLNLIDNGRDLDIEWRGEKIDGVLCTREFMQRVNTLKLYKGN